MATPTLPNDYSQYPVFAADQVLTSDDLNEMFDYLDEQERLSRIYLVGMGIVCGFELTVDLTQYTISVSAGSGVTSFGYLLFSDAVSLSYYQPYTVPATVPTEDQYAPFTPGSASTFYQMMSAADRNNLSLTDQAKWTAISAGGQAFLNGKVVVLYLELSEDQMKSCLTGNCDGPGADMDLTIRYLLVNQSDLDQGTSNIKVGSILSADELPDLFMPRFNVPSGALPDFTSIYTAYSGLFSTNTSGNIITQLSGALQSLYTFLQPILPAYPTSPFMQVQTTLGNLLAGIQKNKPYAIQYFYDFIDDLLLAYQEIQYACGEWRGRCTPQVGIFPLHLALGYANQNTAGQTDAYRDYFIPSTLIAQEPDMVEELRQLFDRINQLINDFLIPAYTVVNNGIGIYQPVKQTTMAIRVTPSSFGKAPLSERAIPYYYPIQASDPVQGTWNYPRTKAGKANQNLSYNAGLYNMLPGGNPYVNPLLYDIMPYNFFRIEGHIGQNYTTVLNNLTNQINNYRLPFNVIALKLGADASDISPDTTVSFGDLTSQYDVLKSSLLCNLGSQVCYYGAQIYTGALQFTNAQLSGLLSKDLTLADINPVFKFDLAPAAGTGGALSAHADSTTGAGASAGADAATGAGASAGATSATQLVSFANLAQVGLVNTDVLKYTSILPVNLRPIFQANIYTKGQFFSAQPCFKSITQGNYKVTNVGTLYVNNISKGLTNPVYTPTDINALYDYLLSVMDMIDSVVADVFYVQLGYLNMTDFTAKYNTMTAYAASIVQLLKAQTNAALVPSGMIDYLNRLQTSCNLGQLTALSQDYQARYTALQQSLLFGNFVTANPAIDHRGGVPRGGTFLLVYYEKPPATTPTPAGAASLSSQLTANLADVNAMKDIISAASSTAAGASAATGAAATSAAGTAATAKAATRPITAARVAVNTTAAAGSKASTLTQLAGIIQDKQFGFTVAQQSQLLGVLNQKSTAAPTTDASFALTNNTVVADFFLPYLYNPHAGPVTYVFPPSTDTGTNPAPTAGFVVPPGPYTYNDPNTYHITISPVITQSDILTQTTDPTMLSNPDSLVLVATATDVTMVPQASNVAKTITSTLQYEAISQPLTIIKPSGAFTINVTQSGGDGGGNGLGGVGSGTGGSGTSSGGGTAGNGLGGDGSGAKASGTADGAAGGTAAARAIKKVAPKMTSVPDAATAPPVEATPVKTPIDVKPVEGTVPPTEIKPVEGTVPPMEVTPVIPPVDVKPIEGTVPPPEATPVIPPVDVKPIEGGPVVAPSQPVATPSQPVTAPSQPVTAPTDPIVVTAGPIMIQLSAKDVGVGATVPTYAWIVNNDTTTVPATASPLLDLDVLLKDAEAQGTIAISLTVTYILNGVTASDTKTTSMYTSELTQAKVNQGPFEPVYNA